MTAPTRILVVEDSADLLAELVDFLRFSNFDAHGADSLAAMNRRLLDESWQVLVLDLGLPDGDGLLAAHDIRARHGLALGLVMMTARGQLEDRVQGLAAGADCYLTKPVALRELKAVIEALLPRLPIAASPRPSEPSEAAAGMAGVRAMNAGPWLLDRRTLRLHSPGGVQLLLTGTEARLLQLLFEARGEVLGRDALCRALGPSGVVVDTRRLDSLISRLRSKVEQQGGEALPIQTFRNLGYAFGGPCGVGAPAAQEQQLAG